MNKRLDEITEDDLHALVRDRIEETQTIEFKRDLPLQSKGEKREVAKDASAMANAAGGRILYGVDEQEVDGARNAAARVCPLTDAGVVSTIDDILSSSIQPRASYRLRPVNVAGGFVLVLDVSPSETDLHQVSAYGDNRYYWRGEKAARPMTEHEVRRAYDRIARLRDGDESRVALVRDQEWAEAAAHRFCILAVPLGVDRTSPLDVVAIRQRLVGRGRRDAEFNLYSRTRDIFEWLMRLRAAGAGLEEESATGAFETAPEGFRVRRDGVVHFGTKEHLPGEQVFRATVALAAVIDTVAIARTIWREAGVAGPFRLLVRVFTDSIPLRIEDPLSMRKLGPAYRNERGKFDVSWKASSHDPGDLGMLAGKAVMDRIWNHMGSDRCPWFDSVGRLLEPLRGGFTIGTLV